ncbi:MAG: (2Fe-2S)-binding protein [Alphaproteobacteria bacterium]|nr:(2Fe-2S)-binding protein [Alphaproteobacteria bacterium]
MRFDRLPEIRPVPRVTLSIDDEPVEARLGDTVTTALLAADAGATRQTPVSGAGRAAYCLMGVCFECLVEIDGVPNRQACLVSVSDGMVVRRQRGATRLPEIGG